MADFMAVQKQIDGAACSAILGEPAILPGYVALRSVLKQLDRVDID
jgi:hypothetical protein